MTRHRISGAVMTHPKRLPAAEALARSAPPGALKVVMDPDPGGKPSVLRTALAAWSAIDDGATHQLVVQDDMILCDSFFERARAAIEEMPHAALALFALWDSRNGAAVRLGAMAGARWVGAVNEYFPCVAIILPRAVAAGFVEYGRRRLDAWPDDILMYQYLRANGIPGYVSVPSFAEHEDHGSISGNAFRGPRRAVAFLSDDRPGDEGRRLEGLRVVPFYKHGVAQCTVRVDGPGPERWLHLECEDYLAGAGIQSKRLEPANVGLTEVHDQQAVRGTWLTAFTMGYVHYLDGRGTDLSRTPALADCLATVGPGGVSHNRSEERIAELRDGLARLALAGVEAGIEAGMEAARRAGGPAGGRGARVPGRTAPDAAEAGAEGPGESEGADPAAVRSVGLIGAATPLGEHILRGLADRGHRVTARAAHPAPRPADRLDALVDLRPLRGDDPVDARVEVGLLDPDTGRAVSSRTLYTGDLYGPGCSRDSAIGRMVWEALRSQPVVLTEPPGPALRPLHVDDLVDALVQVLRSPGTEPALSLAGDEPLDRAGMAEAVRASVRPVPIAAVDAPASPGDPVPLGAPASPAAVSAPRPPDWKPAMDLHHGLHTFAQWLAYEGIRYADE